MDPVFVGRTLFPVFEGTTLFQGKVAFHICLNQVADRYFKIHTGKKIPRIILNPDRTFLFLNWQIISEYSLSSTSRILIL